MSASTSVGSLKALRPTSPTSRYLLQPGWAVSRKTSAILQMSTEMDASYRKTSVIPPIRVTCPSSVPLLPSSCVLSVCILDLTLHRGRDLPHIPQRPPNRADTQET